MAKQPVITVISPPHGAEASCPFRIAFSYPEPVDYMKVWVDGKELAGSTQHPTGALPLYNYTVAAMPLGKHKLSLQAYVTRVKLPVTLDAEITVVDAVKQPPAPTPVEASTPVVATPAKQQPAAKLFRFQDHFAKPILILSHVMPWFGPASQHHSTRCPGYDSADPAVVARQITQMKSLGIGGIIVDYYGMKDSAGAVIYDGRACPVLLHECEKQGLSFAVQPDHGIMKSNKSSIAAQVYFEGQIQSAITAFCGSPTYQRTPDGRFFMPLFGTPAGVNMGAVATKYPKVAFVYQGVGGYEQPGSAGAFAWTPLSGGSSFYGVTPRSGQISVGNLVQGFDDHDPANSTRSAWGGPARFASYAKGQTFLNSLAAATTAMNGKNPPTWLQLVTWNDWQEGTAFEPLPAAQLAKGLISGPYFGTIEAPKA